MKSFLLASVALIGLGGVSNATSLVSTSYVLPTLLTLPVPASSTPIGKVLVGVVGSSGYTYRSPFDTVPADKSTPYTAILGGGSATFDFSPSTTLSLVWGSPDSYNSITFSNGDVVTGASIVPNTGVASTGYAVVTIKESTPFTSAVFTSTVKNAFEISTVVSSVPLPASLPMFGGALLALAGFSYGMSRWVAPKGEAASAA